MEERRLPMRFAWKTCGADCAGFISAVGIVTSDTPADFEEFTHTRNISGATLVLDSSGGSVNDAIALGRRWRKLNLTTTVGTPVDITTTSGEQSAVVTGAYCESMCVFLLLSGATRYVPDGAHVRVHQIWMGDRADNAKAASYTAHDMMIVERDIGRLAKFTFDMGGTGDLLSLALNVPPWEALHELSRSELQLSNLTSTDVAPAILQPLDVTASIGKRGHDDKVSQDRIASDVASAPFDHALPAKPTKTAEAMMPSGLTASAPAR